MATYVALLRAVNVGGTGKLPMADLKSLCAELGFGRIDTYIASGNVVFDCSLAPTKVQSCLAERLLAYAGKEIGVLVRTASQMQTVAKENPFADYELQKVYAFFLPGKPPAGALEGVRGRVDEQIGLGQREIYVYYPAGMGKSRLKIPAAAPGTARNLNTVAKLVELSTR